MQLDFPQKVQLQALAVNSSGQVPQMERRLLSVFAGWIYCLDGGVQSIRVKEPNLSWPKKTSINKHWEQLLSHGPSDPVQDTHS